MFLYVLYVYVYITYVYMYFFNIYLYIIYNENIEHLCSDELQIIFYVTKFILNKINYE